ncbi:MAG: Tol-Pal system protein TolB [Chlamydiia bacterium]|nr:Tol-Pal system protein TolB [Chlamydiia bacterium]
MSKTMRSIKTLFILLLVIAAPVIAEPEGGDEIVVRLTTEAELVPIYLVSFDTKNAGFDAGYIKQLEKVLRFDLSHNGMTALSQANPSLEALAAKATFHDYNQSAEWKSQNIYYVIKVNIVDHLLDASILSVNGNWIKSVDHIALTGEMVRDRHQIHLLADMIHKALFGTEGIARTRVLYTVREKVPGQKKWTADVWEADYDGGNARQVLRDAGYCVTPQYAPAPSGKQPGAFFYVSYKTGQPKIYLASLNGSSISRVTMVRGNQLMPTLNYQRNQIALISDVTGNPDLFILPFSPEEGAIGKPRQIFSAYPATQGTPTFSPDGKKIAFVSNKDGAPRIYTMDIPPEGAKLRDIKPTLLTRYHSATAPAWSPDGKKIAYCSKVEGTRQIFVYDFNKQHEYQLTQGYGNKENPTWAPNSLHLMYNCGDDTTCELYMINLHQPKAVKITQGKGEKRFPHWSPVVPG